MRLLLVEDSHRLRTTLAKALTRQVLGPDGGRWKNRPPWEAIHLISRDVKAFPAYGAIKLPDGRSGRAVWKPFPSREPMQSENLRVIVASYIGGFERSLHSIVLILAGVGLAGLILTVFLVHMCLKLGLRPLDDLGRQLCSTQPAHLHQRFPTAQLPWRKSEARSEKGHTGLGLAVVAACTERLGETCRATLQDQLLRIEIRWNG